MCRQLDLFNNIDYYHYTGLVGLAMAYALSITSRLNNLLINFTEVEKQMVSVERVMQYVEETPKEEQGSFHVCLLFFI